jgi:hypothetical protein
MESQFPRLLASYLSGHSLSFCTHAAQENAYGDSDSLQLAEPDGAARDLGDDRVRNRAGRDDPVHPVRLHRRAPADRDAERDNWIVLSRGTTSEPDSFISRDQYEIIKSRPQIATNAAGEALVSPEIMTGFNPNPDEGVGSMFTQLRGVYPIAYQVQRDMKLVQGRWPAHGAAEWRSGASSLRATRILPWKMIPASASGPGKSLEPTRMPTARASPKCWLTSTLLGQEVHFGNGFEALHVVLRAGHRGGFPRFRSAPTRGRGRPRADEKVRMATRSADHAARDQRRSHGAARSLLRE